MSFWVVWMVVLMDHRLEYLSNVLGLSQKEAANALKGI